MTPARSTLANQEYPRVRLSAGGASGLPVYGSPEDGEQEFFRPLAAQPGLRPENPMQFYVYRLRDPRDGAIFYIGKGKGRRAWHHEESARRGEITNLPRHQRILAILKAKKRVDVEIVARFEEERLAYAHEYDLIQSTAGLTNIAPGIGPVPSREDILQARALATINRLHLSRSTQRKRFVRSLPKKLQGTATEWLAQLDAERTTRRGVKVAAPWLYEPGAPCKRRRGVKGRKRYRNPKTVPQVAVTATDLPPDLSDLSQQY